MYPLEQVAGGGAGGGAAAAPAGAGGRTSRRNLYVIGGIGAGVLALGLTAAALFGRETPRDTQTPHKVANVWVDEGYSKCTNILEAKRQKALMIQECSPDYGGHCTDYRFPGKDAAVYRAARRIKPNDILNWTVGSLDSVREAR